MSANLSIERRTETRNPVTLPVRYCSESLGFTSKGQVFDGTVTDISRNGIFIHSEYLEPPGTSVRIQVRGWEKPAWGQVVWVSDEPPRGPGMGIRLLQDQALAEPSG